MRTRGRAAAASPSLVIPGDVCFQQPAPRRASRPPSGRRTPVVPAERRRARTRRPTLLNAAEAGHDPRRRRLRRAPTTSCSRSPSALQAPDRARAARQGVRRVRQPVRRRHDRAARLRLRLPRHGALRRAADARHRLPVPRSSTREDATDRPGRHPRRAASAGGRRSTSPSSATVRDTARRPAAAASTRRDDRSTSSGCSSTTGGPADGSTTLADRRPRPQAASIRSTSPRSSTELAADDAVFLPDVGTPIVWAARYLHDERPAPADRLVQPRLDGQRPPAGHRRPGRPPGPAGRRALGRRRAGDAAGRAAHAPPAASCP